MVDGFDITPYHQYQRPMNNNDSFFQSSPIQVEHLVLMLSDLLKSARPGLPIVPPVQHKIIITTADGITILPVDQILRLESDGNYTTFFLLGGEKVVASKVMKDFESAIPADLFCRIHQSHIVQLRYVRKFLKDDGCFAVMVNGDIVPVSRRKKDLFLSRLLAG